MMKAKLLLIAVVLPILLLPDYGVDLSHAGPALQTVPAAPARQNTQEFVQITNFDTHQSIQKVRLSGDGKKVAYEIDHDIYVADVSTAAIHYVGHYYHLQGISYDGGKVLSNDGRYVYVNGVNVTPCYSDPLIVNCNTARHRSAFIKQSINRSFRNLFEKASIDRSENDA